MMIALIGTTIDRNTIVRRTKLKLSTSAMTHG